MGAGFGVEVGRTGTVVGCFKALEGGGVLVVGLVQAVKDEL